MELAKLGDLAEPALQKLLASTASVEARHRATRLLVALKPPGQHPGRLRELRFVALLEQIDSAPSRDLLRMLAKLPPDDQRSQDAKSALRRINERPKNASTWNESPRTRSGAEQWALIDDVGKYLKDPKAPVRRGTIGFRINRRSKPEAGKVTIEATYGRGYGGIVMDYALRARVDVSKSTEEEFTLHDFSDVEISYTDTFLEMQRTSEKDIEDLIQSLHQPRNKVGLGPCIIPGGEMLTFSETMKKLIMLGDKARYRLEQCLVDPRIEDEVALVLGAIGNERSVALLIDAYPPFGQTVKNEANEYCGKAVNLTFALTYLTGHQIGRTRWGTDCSPENRKLWTEWWAKEKGTFQVPRAKPMESWVPSYPNLSPECAAEGRKWFSTDYSYMGVKYRP
jgi:hypothetical protein